MDTILVTGAAGFIGASLSRKLINKGFKVIGVDNLNNYYSVSLKKDRLKEIMESTKFNKGEYKGFTFSIENMNKLEKLSNETNLSLIDLALSWVLSRNFLSSILIGVRDISHIMKPINILENPINGTILNEINEITKNNLDLIDP